MASDLIEEVAQALFLANDPVARWCEWEDEYVQKGEGISIADVYRRASKLAIDLIRERLSEPEMQAKLVNVGVGAVLNTDRGKHGMTRHEELAIALPAILTVALKEPSQ